MNIHVDHHWQHLERGPAHDNELAGVAATSASDVWAVGYADSNTLTEHS